MPVWAFFLGAGVLSAIASIASVVVLPWGICLAVGVVLLTWLFGLRVATNGQWSAWNVQVDRAWIVFTVGAFLGICIPVFLQVSNEWAIPLVLTGSAISLGAYVAMTPGGQRGSFLQSMAWSSLGMAFMVYVVARAFAVSGLGLVSLQACTLALLLVSLLCFARVGWNEWELWVLRQTGAKSRSHSVRKLRLARLGMLLGVVSAMLGAASAGVDLAIKLIELFHLIQ